MGATGTAQARGKFGVTPNSAPRTDAEIRAVETYVRLKAAEADLRSVGKACENVGMSFVRAVLALRKETGHGRWMPRLKEWEQARPRRRLVI